VLKIWGGTKTAQEVVSGQKRKGGGKALNLFKGLGGKSKRHVSDAAEDAKEQAVKTRVRTRAIQALG